MSAYGRAHDLVMGRLFEAEQGMNRDPIPGPLHYIGREAVSDVTDHIITDVLHAFGPWEGKS